MSWFERKPKYVLTVIPKPDITAVQVATSIQPLVDIMWASKWGGITKEVIDYAHSNLEGYIVTHREK